MLIKTKNTLELKLHFDFPSVITVGEIISLVFFLSKNI